jgi:hypothetical protein
MQPRHHPPREDGGEPADRQSRGARNSRSRAISQGTVWTVRATLGLRSPMETHLDTHA